MSLASRCCIVAMTSAIDTEAVGAVPSQLNALAFLLIARSLSLGFWLMKKSVTPGWKSGLAVSISRVSMVVQSSWTMFLISAGAYARSSSFDSSSGQTISNVIIHSAELLSPVVPMVFPLCGAHVLAIKNHNNTATMIIATAMMIFFLRFFVFFMRKRKKIKRLYIQLFYGLCMGQDKVLP